MSFEVENLPEAIREAKKKLRKQNPNYAKTFTEVEAEMKREVAEVVKERESGGEIIPIVQYADIAAGRVSDEVKDKIRRRETSRHRWTIHNSGARIRPQPTFWKLPVRSYPNPSLVRGNFLPRSKSMSSPRLAIPDTPQQRNQLQAETERQLQPPATGNIQPQAIANLAYELWQQRGCPQGSPEDDWRRAEQLLQATRTQSALGSR